MGQNSRPQGMPREGLVLASKSTHPILFESHERFIARQGGSG